MKLVTSLRVNKVSLEEDDILRVRHPELQSKTFKIKTQP